MTQSSIQNRVHAGLTHYVAIRAALLSEHPDLDDDVLRDTLEGCTNLHELLATVVRSALEDEALVRALSSRISEMKERLERLETRATRKRQLALRGLGRAKLSFLEAPEFTISLRAGPPRLEIISEDEIPVAYWKPQPSKLDRAGVIAALKAGAVIPGATLTKSDDQLSVRTK